MVCFSYVFKEWIGEGNNSCDIDEQKLSYRKKIAFEISHKLRHVKSEENNNKSAISNNVSKSGTCDRQDIRIHYRYNILRYKHPSQPKHHQVWHPTTAASVFICTFPPTHRIMWVVLVRPWQLFEFQQKLLIYLVISAPDQNMPGTNDNDKWYKGKEQSRPEHGIPTTK